MTLRVPFMLGGLLNVSTINLESVFWKSGKF